jgi:hypothetical protein
MEEKKYFDRIKFLTQNVIDNYYIYEVSYKDSSWCYHAFSYKKLDIDEEVLIELKELKTQIELFDEKEYYYISHKIKNVYYKSEYPELFI